VGRYDLEVVREVEPGRAVEYPAVRLDELRELHLAEVLRPLEHHVLEEVREPGPVARFDAKADVVVDGHHRRRGGRVARKHDLETVRQLVVLDGDGEGIFGRFRGREAAGDHEPGKAGQEANSRGFHRSS
jgi:hypothetical protein